MDIFNFQQWKREILPTEYYFNNQVVQFFHYLKWPLLWLLILPSYFSCRSCLYDAKWQENCTTVSCQSLLPLQTVRRVSGFAQTVIIQGAVRSRRIPMKESSEYSLSNSLISNIKYWLLGSLISFSVGWTVLIVFCILKCFFPDYNNSCLIPIYICFGPFIGVVRASVSPGAK